jgi:uncharacterized tellurite resistance protein B-like protein
MQTFENNSPQAAARIVALTLVADGHIGEAELQRLDDLKVHEQLNLPLDEMHAVMKDFCQDMLGSPQLNWSDVCPLDERELAGLMAQITRPSLRQRVLHLCVQVAEADGHVAEGESTVLNAAVEHWGLQRQMLLPVNESPMTKAA